jgi:hypothetical protein
MSTDSCKGRKAEASSKSACEVDTKKLPPEKTDLVSSYIPSPPPSSLPINPSFTRACVRALRLLDQSPSLFLCILCHCVVRTVPVGLPLLLPCLLH